VYGVGYHVPLYALGDSMDFFGSYSNVDSGTVNRRHFRSAVSGKGLGLRARAITGICPRRAVTNRAGVRRGLQGLPKQRALFGLNWAMTLRASASASLPGQLGRCRTADLNFALTLLHNHCRRSRGGQQLFSNARTGAVGRLHRLAFLRQHDPALPAECKCAVIVNGQYTGDALIPGEQFGAGGATSVRGFERTRDIETIPASSEMSK